SLFLFPPLFLSLFLSQSPFLFPSLFLFPPLFLSLFLSQSLFPLLFPFLPCSLFPFLFLSLDLQDCGSLKLPEPAPSAVLFVFQFHGIRWNQTLCPSRLHLPLQIPVFRLLLSLPIPSPFLPVLCFWKIPVLKSRLFCLSPSETSF